MSSRKFYAGLKILPVSAYEKVFEEVDIDGEQRRITHYKCLFVDGQGRQCDKSFVKSTSLIVHYQRHIDLRPFECDQCGYRFS